MNTDTVADFTESSYNRLLLKARKKFRFVTPGEEPVADAGDPICIWRHDVDVSPHRALQLAKQEVELGVAATYYVMLGSRFYNVFEPSITFILTKIAEMGHRIGLHFDASRYRNSNQDEISSKLRWEAQTLAELMGTQISSFSLHDPTSAQGATLLNMQPRDLFNASLSSYVATFTYCSDSNGLWRHRSLHAVLEDESVRRLYALSHPEWWTPEPASPRHRIQRAIDGRAARCAQEYDEGLAKYGRPNY